MELFDILTDKMFVSGTEIAGILGISRAAVNKRIAVLRKSGYRIDGQKNMGYMLISRPDLLLPGEIKRQLEISGGPETEIHYYKETGSTQSICKELADRGCGEGTVVVAERQAQGYGRMKRAWVSPKGGIWFSIVLRPRMLPDKVPQITLAVSIALCRVIKGLTGVNASIKWPNDVVFEGKKIAGILTEMSAEVGRVNWVVMGIGINANNTAAGELKNTAVSLKDISGIVVNRAELLALLLKEINISFAKLCKKGFLPIKDEYNKLSVLTGKNIEVDAPEGRISGVASGVDEKGLLRVIDGKRTHKIIAGEVSMRGLGRRENG